MLANVAVETPNTDAVYRLYEGALGRAPDASGDAFWSGLLDNSTLVSQVASGILQTAESQQKFAGATSNTGFVVQLYQNVLGRTSDTAGASFWTGLLAGGTTRVDVLVGFTTTAEAIQHNASGTISTLSANT